MAHGLSRREFLMKGSMAGGMLLVAACTGGSSSVSSRPIKGSTVQHWSEDYGTPSDWQKLINDLSAGFQSSSGANVQWKIVPWSNALQTWDLDMVHGTVPDVGDVFYLQSRVYTGLNKWGPLDLTDEVKAGKYGDWNRFPQISQQESMYKGRIYGIPWQISTQAFVYNSKLWPNPPADINEFESMAKQVLASTNVQAAAWPGGGLPYFAISQIGATWDIEPLSSDYTHSNLNDPRWQEALTWAQRMAKERVFFAAGVTSSAASAGAFENQEVAAIFGGFSSELATAQGQAPQVAKVMKSALMPAGPSGKQIGTASVQWWSLFQNSPELDASKAWLQYITRSDINKRLVTVAQLDSPDTTVAKEISDAWHQPFIDQATKSHYIDAPCAGWAELVADPEGPITKLAVAVFNGDDVAKSLKTAHDSVDLILSKYHI